MGAPDAHDAVNRRRGDAQPFGKLAKQHGASGTSCSRAETNQPVGDATVPTYVLIGRRDCAIEE
jgi:hypothetical protein